MVQVECDNNVFIATVDGHVPVVDAGKNRQLTSTQCQCSSRSGVDVSVISEKNFQQGRGVDLQPSRRLLTGPRQFPLSMCGQFTGLIKHSSKEVEEKIFVRTGLKIALIGHPAIETLNLISRVCSIDDLKQKYATQYPNLFQGLRKFEGEYTSYSTARKCQTVCFYNLEKSCTFITVEGRD